MLFALKKIKMLQNIKILVSLVLLLGIFSCNKDTDVDPLFDTDVDSRTEVELDEYRKALVAPEFGWKLEYQPENDIGIFNVYLKFDENGSVNVVSDYNNGDDDLETTYRVGISQFPELVFENYSVFHSLFEVGNFQLNAEFEFVFDKIEGETILLKSKTDPGEKSTVTLVKASTSDMLAIKELQGLDEKVADGYNTDLFFRSLVAKDASDATVFSSSFNFSSLERVASITSLDNESKQVTETRPIKITKEGFDFIEPITISGNEVKSFVYDMDTNTFISLDGGLTTIISHTNIPGLLFYPDVNDFATNFSRYLYFPSTSGNFLAKTSTEFSNLAEGSGVGTINIYFDDPNAGGLSYFSISHTSGTIFAIFTYDVVENEKMTFNFQGAQGDISGIIPLLQVLFNPEGFYIEKTDESTFSANPSYLLINASNANFRFSLYGI